MWVDPAIKEAVHAIQYGNPTVGWEGDIRIGVYLNAGRWELWRYSDDGNYYCFLRSPHGAPLDRNLVCRMLVEADGRRKNVKAEIDLHNAALKAARERDAQDQADAAAEKLHWALRKDIGAYEGGSQHVYQPLPSAPWKDNDA